MFSATDSRKVSADDRSIGCQCDANGKTPYNQVYQHKVEACLVPIVQSFALLKYGEGPESSMLIFRVNWSYHFGCKYFSFSRAILIRKTPTYTPFYRLRERRIRKQSP